MISRLQEFGTHLWDHNVDLVFCMPVLPDSKLPGRQEEERNRVSYPLTIEEGALHSALQGKGDIGKEALKYLTHGCEIASTAAGSPGR